MGDGTTYAIDLAVGGAQSASYAADKLDRLTSSLGVATKSAADASAAMKKGEAAYSEAEGTYDKAAKALEKINVAMQTATGKTLDKLVSRQVDAAKAVGAAKYALDAEATSLDRLRTTAAGADKEVEKLTKAQTDAKKAIDAQKKSQADSFAANELLASSLGKIGGPLGAVGQKAFELRGAWDKMSKALGAAGPYAAIAVAIVAIAASLAAVTVAAVVGVAQIAAWAVGLSDVARSNTLLAAGMVKSAAGGEALSSVIDDITKAVPQTREEISSMAAELAKTGLRGEALYKTLQKNAEKAAATKYGPEWQLQMISLEQSQKRLKGNFDGLFSGLKIDKLLEGLSSLVDLFDESTASGRAIKVVFESLFQPVVDGATGLLPVVRHTFLQFEILALKALIAIKPWGSTLVKVAEVIAVVGAVMVGVLGVAIGLVVGALAGLAAIIVGPIALFAALAAATVYVTSVVADFGVKVVTGIVGGIKSAVTAIGSLVSEIIAAIPGVSFVDTGRRLVEGLVVGIKSGAGAVIDAVSSLGGGMISKAEGVLRIGSPSKVFAEIGAYTAEGMQIGIEKSSGGVEAAMIDMVEPPAPGSGAGAGAAGTVKSGGNTYNFTINAPSGAAEDIADKVRQVLINLTEGTAMQAGV